jgi:hypothetical protein
MEAILKKYEHSGGRAAPNFFPLSGIQLLRFLEVIYLLFHFQALITVICVKNNGFKPWISRYLP